jgi:HEPN domain-containing protein
VTNGERADRPAREARQIAGEMRRALHDEAWNLATRRAQEVLELAIKALLNEMSVDSPKPHDPAPVFVQAIRARGIDVGVGVLDSLRALSQDHAKVRSPAFYQETVVTGAQARDWVERVEQALQFGEDLFRRLRAPGGRADSRPSTR